MYRILAEFILETSYPSRRIIRQTDNSFKYKSEDEFCSIIRLDILPELHDGCFGIEEPSCENIVNIQGVPKVRSSSFMHYSF